MIDTPYYPPYAVDSLHCHNTLEVGVCVTGCGRIRTRTSEWTFSPGAVLLTPREVVRDFTGLLNLLQQNPEESFESIAGTLEIRPADRTENGETGEFAEFTL